MDLYGLLSRDVYKMSMTFKVYWLAKKCEAYFSEQLQTSSSHPDLSTMFDIAQYVLLTFKQRYLLCLVAERLLELVDNERYTRNFLQTYTHDFESLDHRQIQNVILVSGQQANTFTRILIEITKLAFLVS